MRISRILSKINEMTEELKSANRFYQEMIRTKNKNDAVIQGLIDTINTQEKVIDSLINNNFAKDTSLQTVLVKPYRGKPRLYKDGKRLDTDNMTGFDIEWRWDKETEVTVRNE